MAPQQPVPLAIDRLFYLPDLSEHQLMSPDLTLVLETVGTDETESKRAQS